MTAVRVPIMTLLLARLLRLPEGADVASAEMSTDGLCVVLTIEHPDLPVVEEGADPVTAVPLYCTSETETERRVDFIEWGIQTRPGGLAA